MAFLLYSERALLAFAGLLILLCAAAAGAQRTVVVFTVVDEDGVAVPDAQVTATQPGIAPVELRTSYNGQCRASLPSDIPYRIHVEKPGFYQADEAGVDPRLSSVRVTLAHEQIVKEQVSVSASAPGIDTAQPSDRRTMNTPEIVSVPYRTSRDIRNLLPFTPGVVQGAGGQAHAAGAETWETLDTIDGFDVRSPLAGTLDLRVSADAVRSIDVETTRYPAEYGRATGGAIALYTGMGDDRFRFNATNFIPSFRSVNGIRFDEFVPRFTFSGPLRRGRAWWYDAAEIEWNNIYISELPANADTDELIRGSNLLKAQINLTPRNILTAGVLANDYHSPYEGISALVPQASATKRDILAWLPWLRDQWSTKGGALLDMGVGEMRFRDGHEPHGAAPYQITPEQTEGSYFESLTGRASRLEGTAALFLPPIHRAGRHDLHFGVDLDHIGYDQDQVRAPVSYLREDRTLLRQSVFAPAAPFTLHNDEIGGYVEDRWQPAKAWLVAPGVRLDWDTVVRRPLIAPRLAAVWSPATTTKVSAGIGLYYEHTHLDDLAQAYAGTRFDTYYAADGMTPAGPTEETSFTANRATLHAPRAVNWSVGVERELPGRIFGGVNFMQRITSDVFTFTNRSGTGEYALTNARLDRYRSEEIDLRRLFANGYTIFGSYTHSSARTNAALNYLPTPSPLGTQQAGPLPWDTPNRVISWGWLPLPRLRQSWDFVYALDWRSGFPYTAVDATGQVVGAAGGRRFPAYFNFSPGLEWRFHFRGEYFGLRGVMENATDRQNPAVVNNVMDSPQFGAFSEPEGRAFTARLRLIGKK